MPGRRIKLHPEDYYALAGATRGEDRMVVSLLRYPGDLPALPTMAKVRIAPPAGRRFTGIVAQPSALDLAHDGNAIDCEVDGLVFVVCS